jgi:PAS domain-containing protein
MDQQELASLVAQIIASCAAVFMFLARYKEVLSLVWRLLSALVKPFQCFWRWIKLARKIEVAQSEHEKRFAAIEETLFELNKFVREKLTKNGGSSIFDAVKRIEDRQIVSDGRQSALLNDSKNGYFFCNTLGYNSWVNRTYARFLDCGTNELLGFAWKRFIKTEELERYNKIWTNAFKDGCEFEDTVEFVNAHGDKVALHISVSLVQNEKGETTSYIGQVTAL